MYALRILTQSLLMLYVTVGNITNTVSIGVRESVQQWAIKVHWLERTHQEQQQEQQHLTPNRSQYGSFDTAG
jgi:hypothetical protein